MAESKQIGGIYIVTDTETGQEQIGDVDGGFDDAELKKHIEKYGHEGLCEKLIAMSWKVWDTLREINSEKDKAQSVNAN